MNMGQLSQLMATSYYMPYSILHIRFGGAISMTLIVPRSLEISRIDLAMYDLYAKLEC